MVLDFIGMGVVVIVGSNVRVFAFFPVNGRLGKMPHTAVAPRLENPETTPVFRTVFDRPRKIAEIVNGRAWVVVRTPVGLRFGEKTEDWEKRIDSFQPLPGGTCNDLVEYLAQKHEKGSKDMEMFIALNPHDPIPKVNFPIPSLEAWRASGYNYVDTGTDRVEFRTRKAA